MKKNGKKLTYIGATCEILKTYEKPMRTYEIMKKIKEKNLVNIKSKKPQNTLNCLIQKELKKENTKIKQIKIGRYNFYSLNI